MTFKSSIVKFARAYGYDIRHYPPRGVSQNDRKILTSIAEFTMTDIERQVALIDAVRYLSKSKIKGSFVECGVWRGGSSMAMAHTLIQEGETDRKIYLYDTFQGMTPPTAADKTFFGAKASDLYGKFRAKGNAWICAGLEDVKYNMKSTTYPEQNMFFVEGPVEKTIPIQLPEAPIALLRLDTDWYESTKHELIHLFPLLVPGGVLILDDYGYWEGAKKAVDEYFAEHQLNYMLFRTDYAGRVLVKR